MTINSKMLLEKYGIDYDDGMKHCMGDAAFYITVLSIFLDDACFANAKKAYSERDYKNLFEYLHELKGVSGNTALTGLYGTVVPLVELLRNPQSKKDDERDVDAEADRLFALIETEYDRACQGIRFLIGESRG